MTGPVSYGNLARSLHLRGENARLTADLSRLSSELSSGRKALAGAGLARDAGPLAAISRSLATLESHALTVSEAGQVASATQSILDRMDQEADSLSTSLLLVQGTGQSHLVDAAGADARERFKSVVSGLNSSVAGRSLFSGTAFDGPATRTADELLADISAAVSGETTATGVIAAVEAYFGPGGGFETTGYLGSTTPAAEMRVGSDAAVQPAARATDPEIVGVLVSMASAALLDAGVLAGDLDERTALALAAGEKAITARGELTSLRARIGTAEERIDRSGTRIAAEKSALQLARNDMISADPYDTATELQAVQRQLETLYAITGRLSALTLTNYLR